MKKNKDRIIRITNLPVREIVYIHYKEVHRKLFALLGILIIVMLFRIEIIYGIIGIFIFLLYVLKQRKTIDLEICKDCIIKYRDNDFAEIIYFDEILNYQIRHDEHKYIVTFLLNDGDEYEYGYLDRNITHHLQELIGDKNASRT